LEASIGVIELVSFRIGFAVVPGLAPFLPLIKLNLFGIVGSEGASLGANLSRAQRLELLNYQDQLRDPRIKSPASPSETPRAVVLVSDGRNVPQVDLEAMELPLGSRVVVMAPARSKLHAYERYAKVRVPGVTVRLEESAGEFPSLEQLQKIFSERLDSIPILVFPPGFIQLESFRGAAAREGFVFSMPWHPSDRLAMLKLVSDNLPRNLLGKFDEEILTMRFYSDTLSPISIPFNSRGGVLAEAYLSSLTRQRQLETAA